MLNYNKAQYEASYGTGAQLPESTLPEIAFSGRSNVGKSSLLNKVLGRKSLARVSSVPGKTVTVNMFKVDTCRFVDLPGYGYAKVSDKEKQRWAELMETYFSSGRNIKLVVQLVDIRHEISPLDLQMLDFLTSRGIKFVIAATKYDKLNQTQKQENVTRLCQSVAKYDGACVIAFSSLKGDGVQQLREYIEKSLV